MATVDKLVTLALGRIDGLPDDDTRVAALRVLAGSVNEIDDPPADIDRVLERILARGRTLADRTCRARALEDACRAITASTLPLARRRELLDDALSRALDVSDLGERVAGALAALEARLAVKYGDRTEELLEDLFALTKEMTEDDAKGRAILGIVTAFAHAGTTDRARECAQTMPASGRRALALARVAAAVREQGDREEAASLFGRAVAEVRAAAPSYERTRAASELCAYAIETADELEGEGALAAALEVVPSLDSAAWEREALLGAITVLPRTSLWGEVLHEVCMGLGAAIDHVDDLDARVELRGRLAVGLAGLREIDASVRQLQIAADSVGRMRAVGIEGPYVSLPMALPMLEILELLARPEHAIEDLERFAASAVDLLDLLHDGRGVSVLLGEMTRFFANPGLAYPSRVALLDRALAAAHRISDDETRVEVVAHVANALSHAGATERGDALFAGLIGGIGFERARSVRLSRAVALVRLGRTPEARAEIAAAAEVSEASLAHVEDLAVTMARCGFIADMLTEIARIDPSRQDEPRARVADRLVEATYLDPHLREIGLLSLMEGTEGTVQHTISCLLDQLRVLEGLGDVGEILEQAFARTSSLEDARSAAIYDHQMVDALIERIRAARHEDPEPSRADGVREVE